jgi:rhodanese-related sulfurtransferase
MWKMLILKDAAGGWILLSGCLAAGLILNELSEKPLPLFYPPPEVRLDHTVGKLGEGQSQAIASGGDVSLEEMREISADRAALILDARPEVFYRVSHIPSALSLPRDAFEKAYHLLAPRLQTRREQVLVVYCSGNDCQDSQMVEEALQRMGYPHVRVFRGGWSEWDSEKLPEEKE